MAEGTKCLTSTLLRKRRGARGRIVSYHAGSRFMKGNVTAGVGGTIVSAAKRASGRRINGMGGYDGDRIFVHLTGRHGRCRQSSAGPHYLLRQL